MSTESVLLCRCGIPVRVVRLGQSYLTLGHTRNPKNNRHYVQLAQAPRGRQNQPTGASVRLAAGSGTTGSGGPEASLATHARGASLQPSDERRGAHEGRTASDRIPSEVTTIQEPEQSRLSGVPPASAPGSALAAGRRT